MAVDDRQSSHPSSGTETGRWIPGKKGRYQKLEARVIPHKSNSLLELHLEKKEEAKTTCYTGTKQS